MIPGDVMELARKAAADLSVFKDGIHTDVIARAILTDREARSVSIPAGYKLVPVEPTEEMRRVVAADWGRRTWEQYRQVIAASPSHSPSREETETRDPSALLLEAEKALEPFAKAFEKARESYSKRYSDYALGAANFDKMPDRWAMDNLTFNMGHFRAALAVHGRITDEAQRGHARYETISELVSLIERAQQNTPEHFSNWHDAARSTLSKIRGGE